jgi:para-nitrobenzyl esterase
MKQNDRDIDIPIAVPEMKASALAMPTRRTFLNQLTAVGTGVVGSAMLPSGTIAQQHSAGSRCPVPGSAVVASDSSTVVETAAGKIRGFCRKDVYVFEGVPYGDSTSGENRFMPPLPPQHWTGIRNALQYGPVCPSRDYNHFVYDGKNLPKADEDAFLLHRGHAIAVPGEDCLRLNLWTPEINGSHRRPVMVYMHGGGYSGGSGHDLLSYEGESLARNHNVVLVNHNHRLNILGYLNLAGIGGERYASSANVGMLDCVAVLEWVRDNIDRFGGDPGNVTIFGQSGGGGKVVNLMAMPSAKGLFHRAIVQSGPYLKALSADYSHRVALNVLEELGLSHSNLDELQTVPIDRLEGAGAEAIRKVQVPSSTELRRTYGDSNWGPTVDGKTLPHQPFDPSAPSISADVPLLTGTNLHEFTSGLDHRDAQSMTYENMSRLIRETFGDSADSIIEAYREDYPRASPFDLYATIAASSLRIPSFEQARRKAALNAAPSYAYVYSWRTPVLDGRPGTFHACEISYAFDNGELCDHYSGLLAPALRLSRQMGRAWTNFARSGNPNHPDLPHWPAYEDSQRAVMFLDVPCSVRNDPEGNGLRIIAKSYS